MSLLGVLNFVVLQWFGVRLARVYARRLVDHRVVNAWVDQGGGGTVWRSAQLGDVVPIGWSVLRWIWPLTGWWSPYRWIVRRG